MLSRERLKLWLLSLCMLLGLLLSSYAVCSAGASPGAELWLQTSNPSTGRDVAEGVAVDSSGIYIVGIDRSPGSLEWRIEKRSLGDGGLIWSQVNNPSTGTDNALCVAVDASGIYVVGYDSYPGNNEWRIEKRNLTNGSLAWSQTNNPSTGMDYATGVAVDSSGIYIVGIDRSPGSLEWRIEKRSLGDGGLIWSQVNNPSTGDDLARRIAVDSSGIYIVGCDYSVGSYEWRFEKRSLTDGNLVWSQTNNPSTGEDVAFGVAVDSSGIYIVGCDSSPGNGEWRFEKRSLTNGTQPDGAKSQDSFSNALPFVAAGIVVIAITVVCIVIAIKRRKTPQPPSQPPSPDACSYPNPDTKQLSNNIIR